MRFILLIPRAAEWCEYLEGHARRVYSIVDDPLISARTLIRRLHELNNPFAARDVYRRGWSGLHDSEEVDTALAELVLRGYLHPLEIPAGTKKPFIQLIRKRWNRSECLTCRLLTDSPDIPH